MREIRELHSIMPIANIPSVMQYGILSHNQMKRRKISTYSVALQSVQERRDKKFIPGAGPLHDYANLYFDAHNPMLSRVREKNEEICVLQVSSEVLELQGVVITDQNAACDYTGFYPYPAGLERLNFDLIYATFWIHREDLMQDFIHKHIKCAEVLVPNCVDPQYILGAYVCNEAANQKLNEIGFSGIMKIERSLFF